MMRKLLQVVQMAFVFLAVACSGGNEEPVKPVEPIVPEEPVTPPVEPEPEEESKGYAWDVARKLGLGWNLGNQLDAHVDGMPDETCWGNGKATQQTFNKLAEAGITSVRIPVTWLGKVGDAPDYPIDKAWLNRVMDMVTYAENAKLNVIINLHHDGADSQYWLSIKRASASEEANDSIKAQLKAMWTQIAQKFKYKGEFLIFESMNEIHDGVELRPGRGGKMARSAGNSAQVMAKEGNYVTLKLPSSEMRMVRKDCYATIGVLGNSEYKNLSTGKAGRTRYLGIKPTVRGVTMNPVDHPHGGGEGKTGPGGNPKTPWGKPALGYKTRNKKKASSKLIVRRRKK